MLKRGKQVNMMWSKIKNGAYWGLKVEINFNAKVKWSITKVAKIS